MKLTIVAGTRPNFIKVAPLIHALQRVQAIGKDISFRLVHTGQHYDALLSDVFFNEIQIPAPDVNLNVGSGTQSVQAANIMVRFEEELLRNRPDCVIVVGDVNSTMACSLATKKLNIKLAHIEAGIRSFDRSMPEEINRIVTDSITDYFFTTTSYATDNLVQSGVDASNIFFVGNIMIDTLLKNVDRLVKPAFFETEKLQGHHYFVITLHRPVNVDDAKVLNDILGTLTNITGNYKLIFPVHPRTFKSLEGSVVSKKNIICVEPLGYLQFMYLVKHSKGVITDSGGIQEETTCLNIPCITIRDTTERPETIMQGTNVLVGNDRQLLKTELLKIINGKKKISTIPEKWDGHTAERIVEVLQSLIS